MRLINEFFHYVKFISLCGNHVERRKMENAPAIKTNEANLEELNKKIVEIKRKIVLKGESLIIFMNILYSRLFKRQSTRTQSSIFNDFFLAETFCYLPYHNILLLNFRGSKEGQLRRMGKLETWAAFSF